MQPSPQRLQWEENKKVNTRLEKYLGLNYSLLKFAFRVAGRAGTVCPGPRAAVPRLPQDRSTQAFWGRDRNIKGLCGLIPAYVDSLL